MSGQLLVGLERERVLVKGAVRRLSRIVFDLPLRKRRAGDRTGLLVPPPLSVFKRLEPLGFDLDEAREDLRRAFLLFFRRESTLPSEPEPEPEPLSDRFAPESFPSPRPSPRTSAEPPEPTLPSTTPPRRGKWRSSADPEGGQFYFKGSVLDPLDHHLASLRRFKRIRRDMYDLISQTGVNLAPDAFIDRGDVAETHKVDPWFAQTLPGHGAVSYGSIKKIRKIESIVERRFREGKIKGSGKDVDGIIHLRFFYFMRFSKRGVHPTIQPAMEGLTVYVIGAFFDLYRKEKWESGLHEMAIGIAADGTMVPLKTRNVEAVRLPKPKGRSRISAAGGQHWFHRNEWGFDRELRRWAKEKSSTPEEMVRRLFAQAASTHQALNSSMIRIAVKKDGLVAVMNVDITRTPYFFSDRDHVVIDRVKKRIFHIVRPHQRDLGSKVADVHLHFRGLRQFVWNGYEIAITVPGRDHNLDWAHSDLAASTSAARRGRRKQSCRPWPIGQVRARRRL
jgi:hypothetical protein